MSILHSIPNEISVPEWAVEAAIGVHLFDKRYTTFGFNSKTKTVLVKGEEDWLYIAHTPDAYWPKVGRGHP